MHEPSRRTDSRPPGTALRRGPAQGHGHGAACWAPDFKQRIYPAHKVAAVVGTLSDAGVPAAALLSGSGLTEDRLRSAATRISYQQLAAVFRNALRLSPDPAFALRAGQGMRVTAYGMYGYALMSSPSHAAAMEFALKHHRVMGPVAQMSIAHGDETAVFAYAPILSCDPRQDLYRTCVEFVFASHLTLNKDLYGPTFKFARVRATYPAPAHARAYRQLFGCPVEFDQPRNELHVDAAWLADPTPYSDPITNAMAHEMCEQVLAQLDRTEGIAMAIRRLLIEHPGRFPGIEAMAARLSMNPRMLRRKLEVEQTTYRRLLGGVRMSLALEYLRNTDMTNEDIAARLGYSDAANFRHAFTRWTGKSPSDYRAR
jgi:AraC-like DNA-binding protein